MAAPGPPLEVWCIDIARWAPLEPVLAGALDDDERDRARRFVRAPDALRYRVAHGALRVILGGKLGIAPRRVRFAFGAWGKPRLRDAPLRFSLSHSGSIALVAVSPDRDVGVDVEAVRAVPAAADLARRFFSPREAEAIARPPSRDRDLRFLRSWTALEAVLKAQGTGLAAEPPLGGTASAASSAAASASGAGGGRWSVRRLAPAPAYVAAVAAGGGDFALCTRSFG